MFKKNHLSLLLSIVLLLLISTGCSFFDSDDGKNYSVTNYGGLELTADNVVEQWRARRFGEMVQFQYNPPYSSNTPEKLIFQFSLEEPAEGSYPPKLVDVFYGTQDTVTNRYVKYPVSGGRVAIQSANFEGEMSGIVEIFIAKGGESRHARFWIDLSDVE